MDPNACLAEIRQLIAKSYSNKRDFGDADRLAELIESLDTWISTGGFLPKVWEKCNCGCGKIEYEVTR